MALTKVKTDVIVSLDAAKITGLLSAIDGTNLDNVSVGSDQVSRNNLALNVFEDSVRHNMDRLSLSQGWVDTFEDTSDVDGEGVSVPMAGFDGNVDTISSLATTLGISDGKKFTFSCWVDFNEDGTNEDIFRDVGGGTTFVHITRNTDNKFRMFGRAADGGTQVCGAITQGTILAADGPTHIMFSMDLSLPNSADRIKIAINGNLQTLDSYVAQDIDWNMTGNGQTHEISGTSGSQYFNGNMGQFYFAEEYIDLSVQANRELFVSGTGANANPVDLGNNGSKPTGTAPLIYLNNSYGSFQTNLGSGGNFSVTGELVDGGYANGKTYSSKSFTNSYEHLERHSQSFQSAVQKLSNGSNYSNMVGQCLTLSDTSINKVMFRLRGDNSPTGNVVAIITPASGTVGTTAVGTNDIIATSSPIDASSIGSYAYHEFTFPEPVKLTAGDYFIGLSFPHGDNNSVIAVNADDVNEAVAPGNLAINKNNGGWQSVSSGNASAIFSLYGLKNLDLITTGSDDIGNSPSTTPAKGHMEVLLTERPASGTAAFTTATHVNITSQDGGGISNGSFRYVIPSTYINTSGNKIRIKIRTANLTAEDSVCTGMAIVEQAHNEVGVGIPTQVPFGGHNWSSGQLTFPRQTTIWSDWFDFNIDQNKSYLFILDNTNLISGPHDTWGGSVQGAAPAEFLQYSNKPISTGGGSGTYNIAGMNGTVSIFPFTLINAIDEIQIATDQTLNTGGDIIGQMSRDGGSTWDDVSLTRTETQVSGTSRNLLGGEVTFTGAAETNIVGRIKTENKDKITVHGISVNWS